MLCPRCKQGDIVEATVKAIEKDIYVCQECEATWFTPHEISVTSFVDFGTYMEEIGLSPLWDELNIKKNS